MRKLITIILSLACFIGIAQEDYYVSYQQANADIDPILSLDPDVYYNNASIDATATVEGDAVSIWEDLSGNGDDLITGVSPELHLGTDRQVTFNGSSDYLKISDPSICDYTLGVDEFTIIIREGDVVTATGTMVSKAVATGSDRKYAVLKSAGVDWFTINHGGTESAFNYGTSTTNRLIMVVFTTSTVSVYIDGIQVGSSVTLDTTAADHSSQSLNVGSRTDGGYLYNGDIDLVAIVPSALSIVERTLVFDEFQIN